ncbi:hypothetical protein BS78_01G030300 [Paspalum vaginatum]|nr:hypothetical protein BS78_01G030300 [Paspalum vaginatum]
MADQAASTVAAAVIGGITDRALTRVVRTLQAPAAAHEKLLRLELLVLKVRSAIEVSEKNAIESDSLLGWRDRLKEAAAEGGKVLLHFQRRAREDGDGEAARGAADRQQHSAGGALYFTRSSLHAMAQRVRDAARRLFSTDEDMKKLDNSLEKMKLVSRDITQFVALLQVEVSRKGRRAAERRAPPSPPRDVADGSDWEILPDSKQMPRETRSRKRKRKEVFMLEKAVLEEEEGSGRVGADPPLMCRARRPCFGPPCYSRATAPEPVSKETPVAPAAEAEDGENDAISVLLEALRLVETRGVKATDDRDVEGFEWLAQWAAVLREAVERGADVRETLGDVSLGAEDDELRSFARVVDWLSSEVECFSILASLCPTARGSSGISGNSQPKPSIVL